MARKKLKYLSLERASSTMDYQSYARTMAAAEATERRKIPGQRFCDQYGWKLKGYEEVQRPDKITNMGGMIYRTITPVFHIWYRNLSTRENILVEFEGAGIQIKRHVGVTSSEGCGFGRVNLTLHPDNHGEKIYFGYPQEACDYLIRNM